MFPELINNVYIPYHASNPKILSRRQCSVTLIVKLRISICPLLEKGNYQAWYNLHLSQVQFFRESLAFAMVSARFPSRWTLEQMPKAKTGGPSTAELVVWEKGRLYEGRLTTLVCCLGLGKQEQWETPGSKWLVIPSVCLRCAGVALPTIT